MGCATSRRPAAKGRRQDYLAMDTRKEFGPRFLRSVSVDNRESSRCSASKYQREGVAEILAITGESVFSYLIFSCLKENGACAR
jgi:hypothetical protein